MLAVTPFLAALGGIAAHRVAAARWGRFALVVLGCWLVIAVARVHPHELAYANEAAGGPQRLHRLLSDSNVDWGQALPDLHDFLQRSKVRRLWFRYFGMSVPEAYGVERYRCVQGRSFGPHTDSDGPDQDGKELLAVSAYHLMDVGADPQVSAWLRARRPIALPGYAIAVFDITNDKQAYHDLATMAERINDPVTALEAFRRTAELDPGAPEPLAGQARALSRLGRLGEAKIFCSNLLSRSPSAKASDCDWK
jgi:hypothetical protein